MKKMRFQDGSVIVEIIDNPENPNVLVTVSKERWDDDAQQIRLSRSIARAIGICLAGDE